MKQHTTAAIDVVKPQGRIALLCAAAPAVGSDFEPLRRAESPEAVLSFLKEHAAPDMQAAFQWASAAQQATISAQAASIIWPRRASGSSCVLATLLTSLCCAN